MTTSGFERYSALNNPQTVAVRALGFLAGNRPEFDRFLSGSGLSQDDLDRHPIPGEHLAAILDFLIMNEPTLLRFSRAVEVPPEVAYEARRKLARGATMPIPAGRRAGS
jgi:hypothetical protein